MTVSRFRPIAHLSGHDAAVRHQRGDIIGVMVGAMTLVAVVAGIMAYLLGDG